MTQRLLFLDFETYYDTVYSLKKMPPPNYIMDPRYETIGCAFKEGFNQPSIFVDGPDVGAYLAQYDPRTTTTVAFNALFDNCILAWQYGFIPARLVCTMRMAVALRGHLLRSASLASVGESLGVGTKGTAITNACGLHRADLISTPSFWREYQDYANNDNEMNARIFAKLYTEFPADERRTMDHVLRCAIEPKFLVNTVMLTQHLADLRADKIQMLVDAGCPLNVADPQVKQDADIEAFSKELRSNPKFETLLNGLGVDVEYKTSATDPDRKIPAFAKTDAFMADLQEHEDPVVQALACARLGLRSTIEESRGKRILSIAQLPWQTYPNGQPRLQYFGTMPIPLRYSGAHTHRMSGDWLVNMQNLPSGRGKVSKLRKSLEAPPGHEVVVADKAQIECRINAWICGQQDLLDIFLSGGDPYSVLAARIFERHIDKNIDKLERFIGKSGVLGLGFGCGADKFYNMVVRSARLLGMDVHKLLEVWTPHLAQKSVNTYREMNRGIVSTWKKLDIILATAWQGRGAPVRFGPCIIGHGYVEGPNGLRMLYNVLPDDENDEHWYQYGKRKYKMYGSKFLENIVQFLARINLMHDGLRIGDQGFWYCFQAHDELAWVVPTADVARCKAIVKTEMERRPSWARDLPLAAEVASGPNYGDAKP